MTRRVACARRAGVSRSCPSSRPQPRRGRPGRVSSAPGHAEDRPSGGGRSAPAIAGVVSGLALVPASIVAREPRHQFLRVVLFDVFEKGSCSGPSEGRGRLPAVSDDDVLAALEVVESDRCGHVRESTDGTGPDHRIFARAADGAVPCRGVEGQVRRDPGPSGRSTVGNAGMPDREVCVPTTNPSRAPVRQSSRMSRDPVSPSTAASPALPAGPTPSTSPSPTLPTSSTGPSAGLTATRPTQSLWWSTTRPRSRSTADTAPSAPIHGVPWS